MGTQNSFIINSWNHGGNPNNAIDGFRYLRNGLSLAGHEVGISPSLFNTSNIINIFMEYFDLPTAQKLVAAQKKAGLRFVVVATELLTENSFNNVGQDHSETPYSDLGYWQERFDAFKMVAEVAEAIWLMSDYQRPQFEKQFPNKKILTLPMCFDPIYSAENNLFRSPKLYEAVFMGSRTTIRDELIDALKKSNVRLYDPLDVPAFMVGSVVKSALVSLHLHLKTGWPFTSMMRHHVLLSCGSYVISEKSDLPGELDEFVEIVPRNTFVDSVRERILDKTIGSKAEEMQRKYAANGDLGKGFQALVEKSF